MATPIHVKPICIMLVGLPGSGKSTLRTKLTGRFPGLFKVASVDDYIEKHASIEGITFNQAMEKYQTVCVKSCKEDIKLFGMYNENFIWDQVNVADRHKKLKATMNDDRSDFIYTNIAIVCEPPSQDVWLKRVASRSGKEISHSVLAEFERKFTYPKKEEGFDKIFKATEDQKYFQYIKNIVDKQNRP